MRRLLVLLAMLLAGCLSRTVCAADDAGLEYFEKKIRPLLVTHCYECHSADSKKLGGELRLDDADSLRRGGETGAAINATQPEASLLLSAIRYDNDDLKMPPKGRMPEAAIAELTEWVRRGTPAPVGKPLAEQKGESWEQVFQRRLDWWSLHPVRRPAVPKVKLTDWSPHPIDQFVVSRLESAGLSPSHAAEPRTLARRLSLALTGLPPASEQIEAFVSGGAQPTSAIEKLVDDLLASPHFGERWARHWLDVVRFSETHGNEWNYEVHHAWRYRDYLIRAFNDDVPYDQLIREQIAGDLLPEPRWNRVENFRESPIGTAFYRFGEVNHDDCITLKSIGYDVADNQIDTLTKAFQATTVACARCHDHKLDAISTKDYHALLGVVRSSRLVSHTLDGPTANAQTIERLGVLKSKIRREVSRLWLAEAASVGQYLLATHAYRLDRPDNLAVFAPLDPQRLATFAALLQEQPFPLEDPFEPWHAIARAALIDESRVPSEWVRLANSHATEDRTRTEFNQTAFETHTDFRGAKQHGWQVEGQALQHGVASRSGQPWLNSDGTTLFKSLLPAGLHTHGVSEKLNGAIRSPLLSGTKKHLSFQVLGQRSSAVRLVSNNCQLNYANYRALTSPDLHWVTFSPPADREAVRIYAELMTMFDNPKFPDQLSALGGDGANYKLPWEQAAENPRSFFGITRAVWHDGSETPRSEVGHLARIFSPGIVFTVDEVADRYATIIANALRSWADDCATDEDVTWLNALLKRGLLNNSITQSPTLERLVREYRQAENELALPRIAPGVADFGPGCQQPVLMRGDCFRPGELVARRYLEALSPANEVFPAAGSGRLELAARIASRDNPLTARVMVNRVWHHLFGAGLVRTVDDFGHLGELPSHPELLDELAVRFVDEGWSIKKLVRFIVLSRTFQMSSEPSSLARETDPDNRLLQHYSSRRLEAEAIRDAVLTTSGRLDRTLLGPSIQPYREQSNADRRLFAGPLDGLGRRSVYIKNNLMESPQFLGAFNFPGGKVAQGRRDVTNVPAQALALLNDPFVLQQAEVWSQRLVSHTEQTLAARIDAMFVTALSRPPSDVERNRFAQAITLFAELHQVPSDQVLRSVAVWKDAAHALFNLREFISIP